MYYYYEFLGVITLPHIYGIYLLDEGICDMYSIHMGQRDDPQNFVEVVYQAYVRYIDLVGICQAYFVICLAYTWNILFSQKLELEYFRNMPDIYLTKSGIFHIPGGWSVGWC